MCAHMEWEGKVDPETGGLGLPASHCRAGGVSYTSIPLTVKWTHAETIFGESVTENDTALRFFVTIPVLDVLADFMARECVRWVSAI